MCYLSEVPMIIFPSTGFLMKKDPAAVTQEKLAEDIGTTPSYVKREEE